MKTLKLTADLIPEDKGGYSVYCPELDIYTQGETEAECLANLREAAELHLEELRKEKSQKLILVHAKYPHGTSEPETGSMASDPFSDLLFPT